MPHKRFSWASRIKDAEQEYQAVRLGLDWLLDAHYEEIHHLAEARGWDDMAPAALNQADWNLAATYLIRMYSVFELAVSSFWHSLADNHGRDIEGDALLDEVGNERKILSDVIRNVQELRKHRNNLVHRRIDDYANLMVFEVARFDLLAFLEKLPEEWG